MEKKEKIFDEEIRIPDGITIQIDKGIVTVKGKKGEVKKKLLNPDIIMELKNNMLTIKAKKSTKREKRAIGTFKAHIRNMLKGVSEGCIYKLKICSGHFPMNVFVQGDKFIIKNFLGEKVPRTLKIKQGANVKVEGDAVIVDGVDKDLVSQVAADIELLTRRVKFDTRIFQDGIYITSKGGKDIK